MVKQQQIQAALVKVQGTPNRLSNETERGRVIEANGNAFETIKSASTRRYYKDWPKVEWSCR